MSLRCFPCYLVLTYSALFLLTTFELGHCELRVPNRRNRKNFGYVREGDLNVGQLVGFTAGSTCSQFQPSGVLYSKAVQFAVGQINRRTDLLPNITLGFVQMDDCWGSLTAIEAAVYLTGEDPSPDSSNAVSCRPLTWNSTDGSFYPTSFDVVGVVGPAVSTLLVAVAQMLAVFQIPTIGLLSTVNTLSDKASYPYTLRLVPPDLAEEQILLEIARYMGWTYVSMVYSAGAYGDGAFNDIQNMLRTTAADYGICLAVTVRIPTDAADADYDYAVKQLASDPLARVVILYVQPDPDLGGLLSAVRRLVGGGWFVWLGSDTLSGLTNEDYVDLLEGAIYSTYVAGNPIPGFQQFVESLPWSGADTLDTNPQKDCTGNDYWFQRYWQTLTGCNTTAECNNITSLSSSSATVFYFWSIISRAYDAVNLYASALQQTIEQTCPDVFAAPQKTPDRVRNCVRNGELLKNLLNSKTVGVNGKLSFDSNGDFIDDLFIFQLQGRSPSNGNTVRTFEGFQVGIKFADTGKISINYTALSWSAFRRDTTASLEVGLGQGPVESVCSRPCRADEYVVQLSVSCCWRCQSCRPNEIVNANGSGCSACPLYTWPVVLDSDLQRNVSWNPANAMTCSPIDPTVLKPSDPLAAFLIAAATICATVTLVVVGIYGFKHDHRLIKATSRELSAIILSGSLLASVTAVSYAMWPNDILCSYRNVGFHISTNLLYAPLMVKTLRIYRIFAAAKSSVRMPPFVSWQAQMIMTLGFVAFQVILSVLSELLDHSRVERSQPAIYVNYVELYCYKSVAWFLVQLSYNMILMVICASLGFRSRHLPENFNDSQFIFISVATTVFVWILFVPAYFTAYYAYLRSIIIGFCLVLNVIVTLVCQFVRIVYAVFFVPTDRITFNMAAEGGTINQVTPSTALAPSTASVVTKQIQIEKAKHSSSCD